MIRSELEQLIEQKLSIRQIATQLDKSFGSTIYWINKYGLKTQSSYAQTDYKCKHCGETKKAKFVNRGTDRKCHSVCKDCHNKLRTKRYRRYKKIAVEFKGGKCIKCGYNKCEGSLDFHHRDPTQKDPQWKTMRSCSLKRILKEIEKCDLVCSNCHREIHWEN